MPKYYFRASMCMTFIVEVEKNTLISDIKNLFGRALKISRNDITMIRMPLNKLLKDNDKIGDFPPIEGSFVFVNLDGPYSLNDLSNYKTLQLVNPHIQSANYKLPFIYEESTQKEYAVDEFTIFSDNYKMHSSIETNYNNTDDSLLENMSRLFEEEYSKPGEQTSVQFLSKLIDTYRNGTIYDLEKILSNKLSDIDYEIKHSKFQYKIFDNWPKDKISDLRKKLDENESYYDEIIKFVQQDSPEAADFLTKEKERILSKLDSCI